MNCSWKVRISGYRYTKVGRVVFGYLIAGLERHIGPSVVTMRDQFPTPPSSVLDIVCQHDYLSIGFRAYVYNPSQPNSRLRVILLGCQVLLPDNFSSGGGPWNSQSVHFAKQRWVKDVSATAAMIAAIAATAAVMTAAKCSVVQLKGRQMIDGGLGIRDRLCLQEGGGNALHQHCQLNSTALNLGLSCFFQEVSWRLAAESKREDYLLTKNLPPT